MIGKEQNKSNLNLLIGVSGSVATIKLNQLIEGLLPHYNIKIVAT